MTLTVGEDDDDGKGIGKGKYDDGKDGGKDSKGTYDDGKDGGKDGKGKYDDGKDGGKDGKGKNDDEGKDGKGRLWLQVHIKRCCKVMLQRCCKDVPIRFHPQVRIWFLFVVFYMGCFTKNSNLSSSVGVGSESIVLYLFCKKPLNSYSLNSFIVCWSNCISRL